MKVKYLLLTALLWLCSTSALATTLTTRPATFDTSPPIITRTVYVHAGDNLQTAINNAQPGDRLELDPGATFVGNFYFKNKHHLIITTSACACPADGERAMPRHAALMPKILTPNNDPALDFWMKHEPDTQIPANNIRIVGLYISVAPGVPQTNTLVKSGGVGWQPVPEVQPYNIIFDRSIITGEEGTNLFRGLTLNCAYTAVMNCWIDECHVVGQDSQGILAFNGSGPYKFCNNEIRAAGENVMFGGADSKSAALIPSDIEICHNDFFKPFRWKVGDPAYAGIHWSVKNLLEFKCAKRAWVHDNVFEQCWSDGQIGFAFLLTPRNQSGTAPWSTVEDIDIENNVIRRAGSGFQLIGTDYNFPSQRMQRIRIANNQLSEIDAELYGGFGAFLVTTHGAKDVMVECNTVMQTGSTIVADGGAFLHENWTYRNNYSANGGYGVIGSDRGEGNPTLGYYFPGIIFTGNTLVGRTESYYSKYPGNFFPAD